MARDAYRPGDFIDDRSGASAIGLIACLAAAPAALAQDGHHAHGGGSGTGPARGAPIGKQRGGGRTASALDVNILE